MSISRRDVVALARPLPAPLHSNFHPAFPSLRPICVICPQPVRARLKQTLSNRHEIDKTPPLLWNAVESQTRDITCHNHLRPIFQQSRKSLLAKIEAGWDWKKHKQNQRNEHSVFWWQPTMCTYRSSMLKEMLKGSSRLLPAVTFVSRKQPAAKWPQLFWLQKATMQASGLHSASLECPMRDGCDSLRDIFDVQDGQRSI